MTMTMPNKTFYIADTDLPLLEQAQEITGNNLSVTIVRALQQLVHTPVKKETGFEEIVVKVGSKAPYQTKQFKGKLLAVKKDKRPSHAGVLSTAVYQTPKGFFAVRSKHTIDWTSLSQRSEQDWEEWDWSEYMKDRDLRLDIYKTLEELQLHISENLYQEVVQALNGGEIEILDL
jgi:EXLDI family protein